MRLAWSTSSRAGTDVAARGRHALVGATASARLGLPVRRNRRARINRPDRDPRSDLYAVGIVLVRNVVGAAPFRSERPRWSRSIGIWLGVRSAAPVADRRRHPRPSSKNLILKLLSKTPEGAFTRAREPWAQGPGTPARGTGKRAEASRRSSRWGRSDLGEQLQISSKLYGRPRAGGSRTPAGGL